MCSFTLGGETSEEVLHLQKIQERWFGHAGLLEQRHAVSEVVDVITVHVEDHGLRELLRNLWH